MTLMISSGAAKAKKEKVTKKKVTKTARAKWGAEEGEEGEEEEAEVEEEEEDVDEAGDFDSDDDDVRGRREIKEEVDESPPATLIDYQKVIYHSFPSTSPSPKIYRFHRTITLILF